MRVYKKLVIETSDATIVGISRVIDKSAVPLFFVGCILMVLLSTLTASLAVITFFVIIAFCGLVISFWLRRGCLQLFMVSFGLGAISTVVLYWVYILRWGVPYLNGGDDDLTYERQAQIIQNNISYYNREQIGALIDFPDHNSIGYIYFIKLLLTSCDYLGGYNTVIPRIINIGVLSLVANLVVAIGRKIKLSEIKSYFAGQIVAIFPMMLFVASHVFRDIIIVCMLLVVLLFSVSLKDYIHSRSWGKIIGFLVLVILAAWVVNEFRRFYVIPIVAMIFLSILSAFKVPRFFSKIVILLILFIAVLTFSNNPDNNIVSQAIEGVQGYNLGIVDESTRGDGLSVILFSAPEPLKSIGKLMYSIVTPLPVYNPMFEWNVIGLGTIFQAYIFGFVVLGCYIIIQRFEFPALLYGFAILFYSYFNGTFTFRHITQWFPFAVLIGLVGYQRYYMFRKKMYLIVTILLTTLALVYKILK